MKQHIKQELIKESVSNYEEINNLACIHIEEDQFDEAYILLNRNYREHPCLKTINNLAYFYLYIGETINGCRYTDSKTAINLLKTIDYSTNVNELYVPCSMLGHAYYQECDYVHSLMCFEKAYILKQTEECKINYAFLLYITGAVENAMIMFYDLYVNSGSKYMYYCYLFCKTIHQNNSSVHDAVLTMIDECDETNIEELDMIDIIRLLFLQNDFKNVICLYDAIFDDFLINPLDFHIIAYSLSKLNMNDQIEKYYNRILEDYKENYSSPLTQKINELNSIYKNGVIYEKPTIELSVKLQEQCYLFGCVVHNT